MKKPIVLALVLALMSVLASCGENSAFTSVSSTPDGTTDANSLQSDNPPDNNAMDLWKTIDTLTQQIPFSQQKVETVLSTQLTEKPLGSGNDLYHLFESQPITLADGVIIFNVDLRIKRSGDHPGFLVLEMDVTGGTGVTLEQVQAQYSQLTITNTPSGDSLEEEYSYSQIFPWGKLSFGFKARDPERLASIAFDPNQ